MTPTVSVALSGSVVQMQLHAARLWGKNNAAPTVAVREALSSNLADALNAAAARVENAYGRPLVGLKLAATLGLHHSYVGVFDLGDLADSRDTELVDRAVDSWVRQTYQVGSSEVTVRWRRIRGTTCALVSCIRTEAFDALAAFAQSRKLRFTSCQPALHGALEAHATSTGRAEPSTLLWTEWHQGSGQSPLIQLNCFKAGTLVSTWRGWIPDGDAGLAGALGRFHLFNGVSAGVEVRHELWLSPDDSRSEEAPGV